MTELIKENISSIIGIIGTLLGVILGAILESFSRRGKIKLFQKSLNYTFQERTDSGGFSSIGNSITSNTDNLSVSVELEIFNTSSQSKNPGKGGVRSQIKKWSRRYKLFNPAYKTISKWESRLLKALTSILKTF